VDPRGAHLGLLLLLPHAVDRDHERRHRPAVDEHRRVAAQRLDLDQGRLDRAARPLTNRSGCKG